MSWDAAIHGRLVIPRKHREAWLDAELDWGSVSGSDVWDGEILGDTVREIVEDADFEDEIEFLEVAWEGDEIRVQAFLAKDTFNENVLGFAAAWAAAAEFGGRGQLVGMGMLTASFGYRLTVGGGKAKFVAVPEREVGKLDSHEDAKAIEKRIAENMEQLFPAEPKKAAKKKVAKAAKKKVAKKKVAKKKVAKKKVAKKKVAKKKVAKKKVAKK